MGWGQGFNAFAQNASQGIMQGMQLQQKREAEQTENAYRNKTFAIQERQAPMYARDFTYPTAIKIANDLKSYGVSEKNPYIQETMNIAQTGGTSNLDAHEILASKLQEHGQSIRDEVLSSYQKGLEKDLQNPNLNPEQRYENTPIGKKQTELLNSFSGTRDVNGQPVDGLSTTMTKLHGKYFEGTLRDLAQKRALEEAALNKARMGKQDTELARFESLYPDLVKLRGTQEYVKKYVGFKNSLAAPLNVIVPGYQDAEGNPVKTSLRSPNFEKPKGGLQKTPSEADIKEARTKTTMDAVIDEFEGSFKLAEKSLPKNTKERISGYPQRQAAILMQSDPNLTLAANLRQGFLAKFARAAGEVGTLTDQDIARAEQLVPTENDVPEVRKGKLDKMRSLANEIYIRGQRQVNPLGNANTQKQPLSDPLGIR
jgi:hypothetical protein